MFKKKEILVSMLWHLIVLMTNDTEYIFMLLSHVFSVVYCPFIPYILYCRLFKYFVHFSYLLRVICTFRVQIFFIRYIICKYFLPFDSLSFKQFNDTFQIVEVQNFYDIHKDFLLCSSPEILNVFNLFIGGKKYG